MHVYVGHIHTVNTKFYKIGVVCNFKLTGDFPHCSKKFIRHIVGHILKPRVMCHRDNKGMAGDFWIYVKKRNDSIIFVTSFLARDLVTRYFAKNAVFHATTVY